MLVYPGEIVSREEYYLKCIYIRALNVNFKSNHPCVLVKMNNAKLRCGQVFPGTDGELRGTVHESQDILAKLCIRYSSQTMSQDILAKLCFQTF